MRYSVCIPMYNEAANAENTARDLTRALTEAFGADAFEVLFANDGSHDNCGELIAAFHEKDPRVRLVGYPDNRGKGSAVRTAVLAAEGDFILYTDCDMAYGSSTVVAMLRALEQSSSDLLIGSRNVSADGYEGYTLLRKLMSKTYIKVISLAAGFHYTDSQCGIKCFRREAARDIFSRCEINGFAFDLEVLILADQLKKKVGEMGVKILRHNEAASKVNPVRDALRMLRDVRHIKKIHKVQK